MPSNTTSLILGTLVLSLLILRGWRIPAALSTLPLWAPLVYVIGTAISGFERARELAAEAPRDLFTPVLYRGSIEVLSKVEPLGWAIAGGAFLLLLVTAIKGRRGPGEPSAARLTAALLVALTILFTVGAHFLGVSAELLPTSIAIVPCTVILGAMLLISLRLPEDGGSGPENVQTAGLAFALAVAALGIAWQAGNHISYFDRMLNTPLHTKDSGFYCHVDVARLHSSAALLCAYAAAVVGALCSSAITSTTRRVGGFLSMILLLIGPLAVSVTAPFDGHIRAGLESLVRTFPAPTSDLRLPTAFRGWEQRPRQAIGLYVSRSAISVDEVEVVAVTLEQHREREIISIPADQVRNGAIPILTAALREKAQWRRSVADELGDARWKNEPRLLLLLDGSTSTQLRRWLLASARRAGWSQIDEVAHTDEGRHAFRTRDQPDKWQRPENRNWRGSPEKPEGDPDEGTGPQPSPNLELTVAAGEAGYMLQLSPAAGDNPDDEWVIPCTRPGCPSAEDWDEDSLAKHLAAIERDRPELASVRIIVERSHTVEEAGRLEELVSGHTARPCVVELSAPERNAAVGGPSGQVDSTIYSEPSAEECQLHRREGQAYLICTPVGGVSRDEARNTCHGEGFHVLTLDSASEEAWVQEIFETLQPPPGGAWWIGLTYPEVSSYEGGGWAWEDGSPVLFTHWASGLPGEHGREAVCAQMTMDGTWVDVSCSEQLPFICEFD